jgi:transposase
MAKKRPHAYPPDFRQKVVELAQAGRRLDDLASEFGLGRQTVCNWVKQADLDTGRRSDGLTGAEQEEVARLRKRVRQLEVERDILSKRIGVTTVPQAAGVPEESRRDDGGHTLELKQTGCEVLNERAQTGGRKGRLQRSLHKGKPIPILNGRHFAASDCTRAICCGPAIRSRTMSSTTSSLLGKRPNVPAPENGSTITSPGSE